MDPNSRLRALRESRPSPSFPTEPMSRAELAEVVNAELWSSTGRRYALDAHTIARYERGAVRWPSAAYRSAMRKILGVATDQELGFRPSPRGASALAARPADDSPYDLADLEVNGQIPIRVGWPEVEQIRWATSSIAASDNLYGGGLTCAAAVSQLRWTSGLLAVPANKRIRTELAEAIGNMAGVVAFAAFDVGDQKAARRCFRFALQCAEEAGSWSLRSNTLSDMARTAAHAGQLDEALSLIELAQVRSDRVTSTARAMMSMLRGRLLARLGQRLEAAEELAASDAWMERSEPAIDPPWLCYYDRAEHQGSTGRALAVLARGGDPEPAARRLRAAVESAGEQYPRSRTFSRLRLATLLMREGDAAEAAATGRRAAREALEFRSHRMGVELRELARASQSRQSPEALELRHEIDSLTA
jgi:tetratricopeptide (TPR) repeat protein